MQLTATSKAQFFIQNEYYHVEIKENSVLLSSIGSEEHIPFTVWNGKVNVNAACFGARFSSSLTSKMASNKVG